MSHITPCCTVIENAAIALYPDGHRPQIQPASATFFINL